ncbi:MAG: ABC transporter substrate-binding protein [Bacteroidota bacterium]
MDTLKLALDWTPNVNHIGFLVAKEHGYYEENQIDLEISSPADDNYQVTPAKKVELGQADFALCPMESILSYRTKANPAHLKAITTIYKEDVSAIAVLESSEIITPKDLDGKKYASYKARYEDEIVKQMIRNAGGMADIELIYPAKLGIWNTIVKGEYDATWIFLNWEGVQANSENINLRTFKMKDFGIPYSYSPVVAALEKNIVDNSDQHQRFLDATKRGIQKVLQDPSEAANVLTKYIPATDQSIDLLASVEYSLPYFGNMEEWGFMKEHEVQTYLDWIYRYELESQHLDVKDLITNELLA